MRQVVAQLKGAGNDVQSVAESLDRPIREIRAAMSYYAEFRTEIDAASRWATTIEEAERSRWEREQAAFT